MGVAGRIDQSIAEWESKIIPDSEVQSVHDERVNENSRNAIKHFKDLRANYLRQKEALTNPKPEQGTYSGAL